MACVRSVDAGRKVFEDIPIKGTARVYGKAVEAALYKLANDYYDSAWKYTSKGMIGDVRRNIYGPSRIARYINRLR